MSSINSGLVQRARSKVGKALQTGRMLKKPCEVCGSEKVDAHHSDYAKPLDVTWLCKKHHSQWHSENIAKNLYVDASGVEARREEQARTKERKLIAASLKVRFFIKLHRSWPYSSGNRWRLHIEKAYSDTTITRIARPSEKLKYPAEYEAYRKAK